MSSSTSRKINNFPPVIGILCVDIAVELRKKYGDNYYSYIAASYVKYLESAGARVIPIWINRLRSYYENIMEKINGILLPGGAVFFDQGLNNNCKEELHNSCVQSSAFIFEIAKDLNNKGQYFPLWGTCLGFQLMLTHSAKPEDNNVRRGCKEMHCSLHVEFENKEILESSKLFGHKTIDRTMKEKMSHLPFGVHFHKYCITKEDLRSYKIEEQWKVLACNKDDEGLEFITIVEHESLPFYGSQIHPERVVFDNYLASNETHCSLECFELAQYFAKFFVQQCTLNDNKFGSKEEVARHFIHNFPTTIDVEKNMFRQYYLFENDVDYPKELKSLIGHFEQK